MAYSKRAPVDLEPWQFYGWGGQRLVVFDSEQRKRSDELRSKAEGSKHSLLNQWLATAIVGNDLLSSCLYVVGLTFSSAGPMAPICLVVVACMLYLFRWVYSEAVGALPIDGGAYTILLNSTSKHVAATAACLTLLSYVATAVVSASDAVIYLQQVWPELNVMVGVLVLLFLFCCLAIMGVGESATVATGMFITHMITMVIVVIMGIVFIAKDGGSVMKNNWKAPFPDIVEGNPSETHDANHNDTETNPLQVFQDAAPLSAILLAAAEKSVKVIARGNFVTALFFGFGQSLHQSIKVRFGFATRGRVRRSTHDATASRGFFPLQSISLWLTLCPSRKVGGRICC